ncbi:secreted protein [Candidatus Magnetoovum chiemensis]|nr:secreted protein [Candidatus Magnetoovum chiemensis]
MIMKKRLYVIILAGILIYLCFYVSASYFEKKKLLKNKEGEYNEFLALTKEFKILTRQNNKHKKRLNPQEAKGVLEASEELLKTLGLKEKLSEVKPIEAENYKNYKNEKVFIKVEALSINEIVNLLYLIENGKSGFLIKEFKMKKTFSSPDMFDVTMDLSYIKISVF